MRSTLLAVAAVTALALGACSSTEEPQTEETSEVQDPNLNENAGCELLTAKERSRLLGSKLDSVAQADARERGVQCRWQSDKGLIQVTDLQATEWAKTLPDLVANMEKSAELTDQGDKDQLEAAKKLLDGAEDFNAKQACEAFTTLAELGGEKPGTTTTVTYVPIDEQTVGLSAQQCTKGRLTSIIVTKPDLKQSKAFERTVLKALKAAHRRAV
jgi:hypothetical protein